MEAFASELRRIRAKAGKPTYRDMAKRAHIAYSTLSEADKGVALPTLTTVLAYAQACAADPATTAALREQWQHARSRLHTAASPTTPGPPAADTATDPADTTPGTHPAGPEHGTAHPAVPEAGSRATDGRTTPADSTEPADPTTRAQSPQPHTHHLAAGPRQIHGTATAAPLPTPKPALAPLPANTAHNGSPSNTAPDREPGATVLPLPADTVAELHSVGAPAQEQPAEGHPESGNTATRDETADNVAVRVPSPDTPAPPAADTAPAGNASAATDRPKSRSTDGLPPAADAHQPKADRSAQASDTASSGTPHKAVPTTAGTAAMATPQADDHAGHSGAAGPGPDDGSNGSQQARSDIGETSRLPAVPRRTQPRTHVAVAAAIALLAGALAAGAALLPAFLHDGHGNTALPSPDRTTNQSMPDPARPSAGTPAPTAGGLPSGGPTALTDLGNPVPTLTSGSTTPEPGPNPAPTAPAPTTTPSKTQTSGGGGAAPPADPPGIVNEERNVSLSATEPGYRSVGIDYWRQELDNPSSNPNADLWIATDRLYTTNSAALAPIETTPDATPARCARATTWTTRIDLTALHTGDQLCAHSTEGRYAVIRITSLPASSPSGNLVFHGIVWKNPL
ncbi:hypothetical protein GCM10009663_57480 [Kitasatospora arboriphila]|uniref:HTH cro/C1-type domain-containing protein n=1 Tax=Kitasatospora arboriphila TaxID=258052 RepID=A0ABN1TXW4_9ACTN